MQWTTPRDRWIEEVYQIYLCWEHHYQFSKSPKSQVSGEVIDSFLLEYASLTASRTVLQWLSELYFRFKKNILWVQKKNVISMGYSSSTSSWKSWRWMRLDLIFSMRDIYINSNPNPLTKFTSSRSTKFKDILPWNISQMITKTIPISTRIVISYAMKWGILLWFSWKVNGNWENNIRIS